jgi:hypothetical protein
MAEDAVRMEEIGNAFINFNYLNYLKKIMCQEVRTHETVSLKRYYNECNAD